MVRTVRDSTVIQNISGIPVNVNASGQLAVDAVVNVGATTVAVSGDTIIVAAKEVSGTFPNIYVTQSGKGISGIPHKLVVGFSGEIAIAKISGETIVTSVSGNVVNTKISGETVRLISGHNDVNIFAFDPSGQRYNQLWVDTSGGHKLQAVIDAGAISVQISGNVVNTSGGAVKNSGETIAIWQGSGRNGVYLSNQSGNLFVNVDASGRVAVSNSGAGVNVTSGQVQVMSGIVVSKISGEVVRFISGHNDVTIWAFDPSGARYNQLWVNDSGQHALQIAGNLSAVTDISGQFVRAIISVSGASGPTSVGDVTTTSGTAMMTADTKMTFYHAYQTLPITQLSGGTQLLSGNSVRVTLKHIGISGVMMVGSSGTNNAPWCNAVQSGLGYPLKIGDTITIQIDNPEKLRVAVGPSNSSGQRLGYMIENY